jgi:hypothetical protein
MPDAVEAFNLFSHFIRTGSIEGAVAMTHEKGISDREALEARYKKFHDLATARGQRLIALGLDEGKRIALVHLWDYSPGKSGVDIDPGFLIEHEGAWKVLPIFSAPRGKVPYLSDEENSELARLHAAFLKVAVELPKKYAREAEDSSRKK